MYDWVIKGRKTSPSKSPSKTIARGRLPTFQNKLTTALCRLYCSVPKLRANLFDSKPFHDFMNTICGKPIKVPDSTTILRRVHILYEQDEARVIEHIKNNAPKVVTLIFDLWSEDGPYKRSFLNVQIQFGQNFDIKNLNLATVLFKRKKKRRFEIG